MGCGSSNGVLREYDNRLFRESSIPVKLRLLPSAESATSTFSRSTPDIQNRRKSQNIDNGTFERQRLLHDRYESRHDSTTKRTPKEIRAKETNFIGNTNQEKSGCFSPYLAEHPFNERYVDMNQENTSTEQKERKDYASDKKEENKAVYMDGLQPVDVNTVPGYTNDDIAQQQPHPFRRDWFKFGRKVYSKYMYAELIQNHAPEYKRWISREQMFLFRPLDKYPHTHRYVGFPTNQLREMLDCCLVGKWEDVPTEEYLKSMLVSVEDVRDEIYLHGISPRLYDYEKQLTRWLASYPNVKRKNRLDDYTTDPNAMTFPLAGEIIYEATKMRRWMKTYEPFDTELPAEGAWTMIELDLVKNDVATKAQEDVWQSRERRTNLKSPDWMRKRRREIAEVFTWRHRWSPNKAGRYLQFANVLEKGWKEFQRICYTDKLSPKKAINGLDF